MQLELERKRSSETAQELQRCKEKSMQVQKAYEEEEEFITNKLLMRLNELKADRVALVKEVEAEEDFLVNTLHRRLDKVQREKADVESKLSMEQDSALILQRRLKDLTEERLCLLREKAELENTLEAEQEYISLKLTKQVEKLGSEKAALAREKADLARQVEELCHAVAQTRREKVDLEAALEAEEEAAVNKLQRQLQQVTIAYRALETKLESLGVSPRAEGAPVIDATTDWVYGRSPTRERLGASARRDRSLSASSTSSIRCGVSGLHSSTQFHQHGSGNGNGLLLHGSSPHASVSASSSPDARRRMAAQQSHVMSTLVDTMHAQNLL